MEREPEVKRRHGGWLGKRWRWIALGLGCGTLLFTAVMAARYAKAVRATYGKGSPFTTNLTTARYVAGLELEKDWRRVRWHVDRLRSRPGSQNYYTAEMIQVSPADVTAGAPKTRPFEPEQVIKGRIGEPGDAKPAGDGPLADTDGPPAANETWRAPAGDDWARRRSDAQRITPANAANLQLVAMFDAAKELGGAWVHNAEAAPLAWGGLVFWFTADEEIVAVEAKTGAMRWHLKVPHFDYWQRGFLLAEQKDRDAPILYVPFGPFLAALDAGSGKPVASFGDGGVVRIGATSASPVVWGDALLVALYEDSSVVALDLRTGAQRWKVPLLGEHPNFQGGVPWSGMAIDRARDLLFVSTGNPRPALSGITRPGDDRNSDSVIALDLRAQKIKWAFQEVRHDLWDYDVPASPMLTRINVDHRAYDVVVAVTKIGNTLILDRDTGQPIYDFRLRQAPASPYPRELTSPYQPAVETPEPLSGVTFDPSMVTDVSPESRAYVGHQVSEGRAVYGWFRPPELNRDLVVLGVHGGAEWPGASISPAEDRLFVTVNLSPYVLRTYLTADSAYRYEDTLEPRVQALYGSRCATCHLPTREGQYEGKGERATVRYPALHGYTLSDDNKRLFDVDRFRSDHPALEISQEDLHAIWDLFVRWDADLFKNGKPALTFHWRQLLDQDGLPGSKPPWGKIEALDLGTGKKLWEVPFGEKIIGGAPRATGSPSFGGLTSTAGNVIFATGTDDGYVVALDAATGKTLWRYRMAAAGSAPPTTFVHDGKQYLCVVASGGRFSNFTEQANRLYVFAL